MSSEAGRFAALDAPVPTRDSARAESRPGRAMGRPPLGAEGLGLLMLCLVIIPLGAALRGHDLGRDSFDCEELFAVRIPGADWKQVGAVVARDVFHTNHPPLMTVPFLLWERAFGTTEASVRALPFALGIGSVLLMYGLGRRMGGTLVGLLAAAALALNPLHIAYSREARQYSMLVALTLAAHLFFLRSLRRGHRLDLACYSLFAAWGDFTHYFAIPAQSAHALIASWIVLTGDKDTRRNAIQALLALAVAVVLFLPCLPLITYQSRTNWRHLGQGDTATILSYLRDVAGLGGGGDALEASAGVGLLLLIVSAVYGYRHHRLAASPGEARAPLPQPASIALLFIGLAAAIASSAFAPNLVLAPARSVLIGYGYSEVVIREELGLLRLVLVLFPVAVAAVGVLGLTWGRLVWWLDRLPRLCGPRRPPSVGFVAAALLVMPIVSVRIIAMRGVAFLSPRNLLILAPPLALCIALGLNALLRSPVGRVLALAAAACLLLGWTDYEPIAWALGRRGLALENHEIPWRDLARIRGRFAGEADEFVAPRAPETDAMLYYLASRHPTRVDDAAGLEAVVRRHGGVIFVDPIILHRMSDFGPPLRRRGLESRLLYQDAHFRVYRVSARRAPPRPLGGAGPQAGRGDSP